MTRLDRAVVAGTLAAAGFLVLTVLVATGATQPLDAAAREFFRPHGEWTRAQTGFDILVQGLQPRVAASLLALAGLGRSLLQRSWCPAVHAAAIGVVGGLSALAVKVAVGRPDPSNHVPAVGGSFPSGHVLSVVVCLGGVVLVLGHRSRWWEWALVMLTGGAMAYGLLIQSAHWLTDVIGGVLLGLSVIAAASACHPSGAGRRTPATGTSPSRPESSSSPHRGVSG